MSTEPNTLCPALLPSCCSALWHARQRDLHIRRGVPDRFAIAVGATSTSNCSAYADTVRNEYEVTTLCCTNSSATARGDGSYNYASCFSATPLDCADTGGFLNKFIADEVLPQEYPLVTTEGTTCSGGHIVGTVTVGCAPSAPGNRDARVTIGPANNVVVKNAIVAASFYLGCMPPSGPLRCTAPKFNTTRTVCKATSGTTSCGGRIPAANLTAEGAPFTATLGCRCSQVHWVVYESSARFTVSREVVEDASPYSRCPV